MDGHNIIVIQNFIKEVSFMHILPSSNNWKGRIDSESDILSFRYHQKVKLANSFNIINIDSSSKTFGIIGFKCDEGVRRNKGRTGAAEGPDHIRQALAKLPWHLSSQTTLIDTGDVKCEGVQMERAQEKLGTEISNLLKKGIFPLILGGGHETFYGHYLGVRHHIGPEAKLGIINIDAHFDMRPYDEGTSSGTMFKQILDIDSNSSYLVAGIQKQGNTQALFKTAQEYNVNYILEEDITFDQFENVKNRINNFIEKNDFIILTLCTDVIGSAYAPGVSAPSAFGFEPKIIRALIRHIVSNPKITSFDISEVNPSLDEGGRTVSIAAALLNDAILNINLNY